jgi:hypothetical protein
MFVCWLKRLRRDVAAEMRAVEMDFFHGGVSRRLRGFQILRPGRHAKNAPAIRDDFISAFRRAGVKNFCIW